MPFSHPDLRGRRVGERADLVDVQPQPTRIDQCGEPVEGFCTGQAVRERAGNPT